MPELPEVESVRRGLEAAIVGLTVTRVRLLRPDVVSGRRTPGALLLGATIERLERHGKQLAVVARRGDEAPTLCIHLGMTGQLLLEEELSGHRAARRDHVHARWSLARAGDGRGAATTLMFRDPRRFGGVWTFDSEESLRRQRWRRLGPDALLASDPDDPRLVRLWRSARAIKAALLDQSLIAGVGNIYADEALFRAGVRPRRRASTLTGEERARMLLALGEVLSEAILAGGSTLRDYRRPGGDPGSFQVRHRVYGRSGEPCVSCRMPLVAAIVGQRTTVWCKRCQR